MKKPVFLILFFVVLYASGISQQVIFEKLYGDTTNSFGRDILETADGGFTVLSENKSKIYLFQIDSSGTVKWDQSFDFHSSDSRIKLIQTLDTGYIILNYSGTQVIKTNKYGNLEWEAVYSDSIGKMIGSNDIVETSSNEYILTGIEVTNLVDDRLFVLIISNTGSVKYYKTYLNQRATGKAIQEITGKNFLVYGTLITPDAVSGWNFDDLYLLKIDKMGNFLCDSVYATQGNSSAESILLKTNNEIQLFFYAPPEYPSGLAPRIGILTIDTTWNVLDTIFIDSLLFDDLAVSRTHDKGCFFVSYNAVKTDSLFEYEYSIKGHFSRGIQTRNGAYILVGTEFTYIPPDEFEPVEHSIVLAKYKFAEDPVTSTDFNMDNSASRYSLFPNPFSDHATISFLDQNEVSVFIYNSMGHCVRQYSKIKIDFFPIHKENLPAGIYHVVIVDQKNRRSAIKTVIL
jgi:hypothetical protein